MNAPETTLAVLAAAPALPAAAARALAAGSGPFVRRVLAGRADLDPALADTLTRDADRVTRRYAAAALRDPERIAALAATGGGAIQAGLAANPHTPAALLTRYARGPLGARTAATRTALANPATDADVVEQVVATHHQLLVVGDGADSFRALAAARILAAHPHVARHWTAGNSTVVRLVARQPDIAPEVVAGIRAGSRTAGRRVLTGNPWAGPAPLPAGLDADPRAACAPGPGQVDLVAAGSSTLDLLMLRAGPTPATVAAWFARRTPQLEPDVLSDVLAGADLGTYLAAVRSFAATRLRAIADERPLLPVLLTARTLPAPEEVTEAVCRLGQDEDGWALLVRLLARESTPLPDLVTVALGVAA